MALLPPAQTLTSYIAGATSVQDKGRRSLSQQAVHTVFDSLNRAVMCAIGLGRVYDLAGTAKNYGAHFIRQTYSAGTWTSDSLRDVPNAIPAASDNMAVWGDYSAGGADGVGITITDGEPYPTTTYFELDNTGLVTIYKWDGVDNIQHQIIESPLYLNNLPTATELSGPYVNCWNLVANNRYYCNGGESFGGQVEFLSNGMLVISAETAWTALTYDGTSDNKGRLYYYTYNSGTDQWDYAGYIQNPNTTDGFAYLGMESWANDLVVTGSGTEAPKLYNFGTLAPVLQATLTVVDTASFSPYPVTRKSLAMYGTSSTTQQILIGHQKSVVNAAGVDDSLLQAGRISHWVASDSFATPTYFEAGTRVSSGAWGAVVSIMGTNLFGVISEPTSGSSVLEFFKNAGAGHTLYTTEAMPANNSNSISGFGYGVNNQFITPVLGDGVDAQGYDYLFDAGGYYIWEDNNTDVVLSGQEDFTIGQTYIDGIITDGMIDTTARRLGDVSDETQYWGAYMTTSKSGSDLACVWPSEKYFYDSATNTYRYQGTDGGGMIYIAQKQQDDTYLINTNEIIQNAEEFPSGDSGFGKGGIALDGDYLIVGNYLSRNDVNGVTHPQVQGLLICYQRQLGVWVYTQRIDIPDASTSSGDRLGEAGLDIDASIGRMVVGVPNKDGAYVYNLVNGLWVYSHKITPSDGGGSFGADIAMAGDALIVGASTHGYDENGLNYLAGAGACYVYAYDYTINQYVFSQKLVAIKRTQDGNFGAIARMLGTQATIGHPQDDFDENGAFFIDKGGSFETWQNSYGTWSRLQKFVEATRTANNRFGSNLVVYTGRAIVGNYSAISGGIVGGAAYKKTAPLWDVAPQVETPDTFPAYGALAGGAGRMMIGDALVNTNQGAIYIYDLPALGQDVNRSALLLFAG